MKFTTKIAAVSATVLSCAGLVLAGSTPASAASSAKVTFCNGAGSGFDYDATFPNRGAWSTFVVTSGHCIPAITVTAGEPYYVTFTRHNSGGFSRVDPSLHKVRNCTSKVAFWGSFDSPKADSKCL